MASYLDAVHAADFLVRLDAAAMMDKAVALTLKWYGPVVTCSRKVFIPLTELCHDVRHYGNVAERRRGESDRPTLLSLRCWRSRGRASRR